MNVFDVSRMIDRAAKLTHVDGNRRYHHWIFQVDEDFTVSRMTDMRSNKTSTVFEKKEVQPAPRLSAGEFLTYDECSACEGDGCTACDGEGTIPVIRRDPKPQKFGVMT